MPIYLYLRMHSFMQVPQQVPEVWPAAGAVTMSDVPASGAQSAGASAEGQVRDLRGRSPFFAGLSC